MIPYPFSRIVYAKYEIVYLLPHLRPTFMGYRIPGYSRRRPYLAEGLTWTLAVTAYCIFAIVDWPFVIDGVLAARLHCFGGIILVVGGVFTLPRLWRSTALASNIRKGFFRIGASSVAFLLITLTIQTLFNQRSRFFIALGMDPMTKAEIHILPGGKEVEVRGQLGSGSASRFVRLLEEHPEVLTVHLNSPGGWLREGALIAEAIGKAGITTYSATGCYSACVLAYTAGSRRFLHPEARVGLHSVSGAGLDPLYVEEGNKDFEEALLVAGASKQFASKISTTPANKMWLPHPQELIANKIVHELKQVSNNESGESLWEYDAQIEEYLIDYSFLRSYTTADWQTYRQFWRSLQLAFRRGASHRETHGHVLRVVNKLETERITRVRVNTVAKYAERLLAAARVFADSDPRQCLAILGYNKADLTLRSPDGLVAINPAIEALLEDPAASLPISREARDNALYTVARYAKSDPNLFDVLVSSDSANPRALCSAVIWLFEVALQHNSLTAAGFVLSLRID